MSVFYWMVLSRAVKPTNSKPSAPIVRAKMTAVLTIYTDGRKGKLLIIGSCNNPKSYPKGIHPLRKLGAHYVGQSNSWCTQRIWAENLKDMDDKCGRQFKKVLHVVENCSAHSLSYDEMKNVQNLFLPLKMESLLQLVTASVGRSLNAAFRSLRTQQILDIDGLDNDKNKKVRLRKAVTGHDRVLLMEKAWKMGPKNVVLNGWLATSILAFHQELDAKQILGKSASVVERAIELSLDLFLRQIV